MSNQPPATILFVGPNGNDQAALAAALRAAGFRLLEARTGCQALDLAREGPDLIILGADLPNGSGPDLRRLRAAPGMDGVPVLRLGGPDGAAPPREQRAGYLPGFADPGQVLSQIRVLLPLRRTQPALTDSQARLRDMLAHPPGLAY